MHDPMTRLFAIPCPWRRRVFGGPTYYRPPLIEFWHVDPDVFGVDDSCRLARRYTKEYPKHGAVDDKWRDDFLKKCSWAMRHLPRALHFHHIHLRMPLLWQLKRWLNTRCQHCGKRFAWEGTHRVAGWVPHDEDGPFWFRGEKGLFHDVCYLAFADKTRSKKLAAVLAITANGRDPEGALADQMPYLPSSKPTLAGITAAAVKSMPLPSDKADFDHLFTPEGILPLPVELLHGVRDDLRNILMRYAGAPLVNSTWESMRAEIELGLRPLVNHGVALRVTKVYPADGTRQISWIGIEGDPSVLKEIGVCDIGMPANLKLFPEQIPQVEA